MDYPKPGEARTRKRPTRPADIQIARLTAAEIVYLG
jgi:hypothetical protein